MDVDNSKLAEKMLLFLYSFSQTGTEININTFKRYIYLYYMSKKFIENDDMDSVVIVLERGNIQIASFDTILNDFESRDYLICRDNIITITDTLKITVTGLLDHQGYFSSLLKQIIPFVTLLQSYDDQFVFTIFFSEPTFTDASKRNLRELKPQDSRLSKLLIKFKEKIADEKIDNYDILSHWMDYVLKNYYELDGEK